ncbi:MAG: hypothetical protein H0V47_00450 [Chloroflexia bacterium]|nr:hypothetical protein [Chloroflexia bacterium]
MTVSQTSELAGEHTTRAGWVTAGALMGAVAGVILAMFDVIMAWIMGNGFFMPLRMIGAIALGEEALEPSYSLLTAGVVGLLVHMVLSIILGAIAGTVIAAVTLLQTNAVVLVIATTIFGFLLWIVNFFVIAPAAFEWFTMADDVVQFVAHTFFFGMALGLLLIGWHRSRSRLSD